MSCESECCCRERDEEREAPSSALEILKQRFVRGEINKAEFDETRQIISELHDMVQSKASKHHSCC